MAKSLCAAMDAETEIDGTLQSGGEGNRLQGRTEDVIGDADDAKGDADGHQHLRQFRCAVNPPVEKTLQRDGDDDRAEHGEDDRQAIGKPEIARRIGSDIAPDHGKCAMGKVDHPHQAHGHRKADRDDEQDHPIGQGIDRYAENLHRNIRSCISACIRSNAVLERPYCTCVRGVKVCAVFCRAVPDPAAFQTS